MKQSICLILIISIIFCLCGCARSSENLQVPAKFYYCTSQESYKTERVAVNSELREAQSYADDLESLLNLYLQGPESNELISPFPDSVTVESFTHEDTAVSIVLSSRFARLTGISLTLACACLSMTIMDNTNYDCVNISVRHVLLDGNEYITMTRESLLLNNSFAETSQ